MFQDLCYIKFVFLHHEGVLRVNIRMSLSVTLCFHSVRLQVILEYGKD